MSFDFTSLITAQQAHAESCTKRPCAACCRDKCACGADMLLEGTSRLLDGEVKIMKLCEACADDVVRRRALAKVEAMIPKAFVWATIRAPELPKRCSASRAQIQEALNECVRGRRGLTIIGEAGAGKTSLAVALFRAMLTAGSRQDASKGQRSRAERSRFASSFALARSAAQHPLGEGTAPLVEQATRASLLVLDDLGSEQDTALSPVPAVIYDRHAADRQTWITTWLDESAALTKYGDGIRRRIFENALVIDLRKAR